MSELYGTHYVVPSMTAQKRAWKMCGGSVREYQILRRHALKLAHFPNCGDWDWIQTAKGKQLGELRIDETIANQTNIRVIFFKSNIILDADPLPRIWTLTTFPKKSDSFSKKEVDAFVAMRDIVVLRNYGSGDHS